MTLQKYIKKRDFSKTREPGAHHTKASAKNSKLKFVVQRHHASRLHYDFRLEMEGVLKSWAVPKGPSLNPSDKRLAMMVEDHPYDYRTFEGTIPKGNYGAGVVHIFDDGTYEALDGGNEKDLLKGLHSGNLKFRLNGKILKGEFALVHIKSSEDNAWLLLKHNDEFAVKKPFNTEDLVSASIKKKGVDFKNEDGKNSKSKQRVIPDPEPHELEQENEITAKFGRKTVKLTNLNKVYWPDEGITKGELLGYYEQIKDYILPHLKDRPLSLNRHPNGIKEPGFFQKDLDLDKVPKWIKSAPLYSESNDKDIDYLICNDEATLLWMANLGCIEINPWLSRYKKPDNPLFAVLDLDPHDIDFEEAISVALSAKELMDRMKLRSFIKTSGSKGLHIFIPVGAKYDYQITKDFVRYLGEQLLDMHPDTTSLERSPAKRKNKIYLDFLQNRRGQTIAAPYSARPKAGATVSAPLDWKEVAPGLNLKDYTIFNMADRLRKKGDLWEDVFSVKNDLLKALRNFKG
ncbi:non-homologous end-joining DNA ligase [Pedobacter faecalis]|uniref:non-homologous end-joining DNA ligase n=1 Tax=Pedobacter faecalis TaxID=3041495 RepID=UPI00254DB363|nr:non-homologous end-joining DNA ligase [Pedobacter sp. ELA7]